MSAIPSEELSFPWSHLPISFKAFKIVFINRAFFYKKCASSLYYGKRSLTH
ncbi:hypothetical protein Cabys_618 [Caldithrix abyssi DSM 13497]|uniref:Uncharacterized protein n=1 Tax=Caldithrix abyssi DSM 13497 TaxID=880073 RepID=A0A1J1C4Z6_CALAY|nr:hypothetical protein Cabys_618 [Caldithrix abyssi DSM 13497]